jgi:ribosomal protein S18 acetylase RimI-like enzyme
MGRDDKRAIELNEVEWWSNWGKVRWLDDGCYVLSSAVFDEPFFNRAGFLSCNASKRGILKAEGAFRQVREVPHLTLFGACASSASLLRTRGYSVVDAMAVMESGKTAIPVNGEVLVRQAGPQDIDQWSETYLLSFYGELTLKSRMVEVAKRLSRLEGATLLIGELDGKVAGVSALYETPGYLGLYCLGTLPKCRGRGVARSLLGAAQSIAVREGRKLVLQSLLSEETHPFYSRLGFRRLYVKAFLRKNTSDRGPVSLERLPSLSGILIRRDAGVGPHLFAGVFQGFESVGAVREVFGGATPRILSELPLEVVDGEGYMHINAVKGSIVVSESYLKRGDQKYLYLDAIHELVHIKQHMEGKELWNRRYKYVDRPTELEAYRITVAEARRIGLVDEQLVDYLKVEWVNEEDFAKLLASLGVNRK